MRATIGGVLIAVTLLTSVSNAQPTPRHSDNTPNSHLLIADCNTGRTEYRPAAIPLSRSTTITRSPRSDEGPTYASLGELGARSSRVHSAQYPDAR